MEHLSFCSLFHSGGLSGESSVREKTKKIDTLSSDLTIIRIHRTRTLKNSLYL